MRGWPWFSRVRSVKGSEWAACNLRMGRRQLCSDDGNPGDPSVRWGFNMILVKTEHAPSYRAAQRFRSASRMPGILRDSPLQIMNRAIGSAYLIETPSTTGHSLASSLPHQARAAGRVPIDQQIRLAHQGCRRPASAPTGSPLFIGSPGYERDSRPAREVPRASGTHTPDRNS